MGVVERKLLVWILSQRGCVVRSSGVIDRPIFSMLSIKLACPIYLRGKVRALRELYVKAGTPIFSRVEFKEGKIYYGVSSVFFSGAFGLEEPTFQVNIKEFAKLSRLGDQCVYLLVASSSKSEGVIGVKDYPWVKREGLNYYFSRISDFKVRRLEGGQVKYRKL